MEVDENLEPEADSWLCSFLEGPLKLLIPSLVLLGPLNEEQSLQVTLNYHYKTLEGGQISTVWGWIFHGSLSPWKHLC